MWQGGKSYGKWGKYHQVFKTWLVAINIIGQKKANDWNRLHLKGVIWTYELEQGMLFRYLGTKNSRQREQAVEKTLRQENAEGVWEAAKRLVWPKAEWVITEDMRSNG